MHGAPDFPYSPARPVVGLEQCRFYHTMDLPGVGLVTGPWDLRGGLADYLGHVELSGKRVLEVGTASGCLCFEMERLGAEVVACDLGGTSGGWDLVPFGGAADPGLSAERSLGLGMINNSFWLAHRALGSRARVVYGAVYDLPAEIGPVDAAVFGAVLLHLRDPFLALERALRLVRETVVVTEPAGRAARALGRLPQRARLRLLRSNRPPARPRLLPDPYGRRPNETWWALDPPTVARMVQVLGFEVVGLGLHSQVYEGRAQPMYTLVGRRSPPGGAPVER